MGVRGLTTLLQKRGILPSDTTRRNDDTKPFPYAQDKEIEAKSNLAIDGSSFVFHIIRLAYYKHYQFITSDDRQDDFYDRKHLLLNLLPSFMPLSIIESITNDILLQFLQKYKVNIRIYLDGSRRILKRQTDKLRINKRERRESNLRLFITKNILPNVFKSASKVPVADVFLDEFPFPALCFDQIIYLFDLMEHKVSFGQVNVDCSFQVIRCPDEADRIVAMASAIDVTNNTFAVGTDSDYIIYGFPTEHDGWLVGDLNVQYVPLNLLEMGNDAPKLKGVVLTRQSVANSLRLSEHLLMEASILMGNDHTKSYVDSRNDMIQHTNFFRDFCGTGDCFHPYDIIDFFTGISDYYKVTSNDQDFQLSINFTRDLFSFKDISDYPTDAEADSRSKRDSFEECSNSFSENDASEAILEVNVVKDDNSKSTMNQQIIAPFIRCNPIREHEKFHFSVLEEYLELCDSFGGKIEYIPPLLKWKSILITRQLEMCIKLVLKVRRKQGILPSDECSPSRIFHLGFLHESLNDINIDNDNLKVDSEATKNEILRDTATVGDIMPCIIEAEPSHGDKAESVQQRQLLPIDEFKDEILSNIKENRITVIQGETGCGKSSRVPVMLLEAPPPDPKLTKVKMFISQPRRIAAKSLTERVRSSERHLRDLIGLRMGMGVKEYETPKTRAWYCTTGYLVRLLAKYPESFRDCTHLIIDEVHERSIDTDVLCLLARRLLFSFPYIRLVLMSATIAAEIYCVYFDVSQKPIFVGRRCFPIREFFLEDIQEKIQMGTEEQTMMKEIESICLASKCKNPPNARYMGYLHHIIVQLALTFGGDKSSVLVFVPGMADIVSIMEYLDGIVTVGKKYTCIPIHSDIQFEEQLLAFRPPSKGEVKVILATNAAESSVTLPDVDHVICTGLCKQIVYNEKSHRQMLEPSWISKASATQRAGRTGRVRPGNVYRLYPRKAFEAYLAPFELGEILRSPLDTVILNLRKIVCEESVTKLLLECLEPPKVETIERSLNSLHKLGFIDEAVEEFNITSLGDFVVSLGIDCTLGALIGLGIKLGVPSAAIEIANVLSISLSPWRTPNSLMQEPEIYNDIASKSQKSMAQFDANLYSEPMAMVNLLYAFEHYQASQHAFCKIYNVSYPRIKHLLSSRNVLRDRVAVALGKNFTRTDLYLRMPLSKMSHATITILRFINLWLFHGNLIELDMRKDLIVDKSISLKVLGDVIEERHLCQLLDKTRHPFTLKTYQNITSTGYFQPMAIDDDLVTLEFDDFENRMLSLAKIRGFNLIISYYQLDGIAIYAQIGIKDEIKFLIEDHYSLENVFLFTKRNKQKCGWKSRNCGEFCFDKKEGDHHVLEKNTGENLILKYCFNYSSKDSSSKVLNNAFKKLKQKVKTKAQVFNMLSIRIGKGNLEGREIPLNMQTRGYFDRFSIQDMKDLFGTTNISLHTYSSNPVQTLILNPTPQVHSSKSSCQEPIFNNVHEGFGILSAVASLQRRTPGIYFREGNNESSNENSHEEFGNIKVVIKDAKISDRWKQFPSGDPLFFNANNFPSTMFPVDNVKIYACCANSLLLRGGMVKVEGLTILPSSNAFFSLAMRCIGVYYGGNDNSDNLTTSPILENLADLFFESFHRFDNLDYQPSAVQLLERIFKLNEHGNIHQYDKEGSCQGYEQKENHKESYTEYLIDRMGSENLPVCFVKLQNERKEATDTEVTTKFLHKPFENLKV